MKDHTQDLMPQSQEAESGLIGSLLLSPRNVGALCAERGIQTMHFVSPAKSIVFGLCMELWTDSRPFDEIILTNLLRTRGQLDEVGGPFVFSDFQLPTAIMAEQYVEILIEKWTLREIIRIGQEYAEKAWEEPENPSVLLGEVAVELSNAASFAQRRPQSTLKELLRDKLARMQAGEAGEDYIASGLSKLDEHAPLRLGDMVLVSGERKSGKSILAVTIASNVAVAGWSILYFSLEDRREKIVDRLLANASGIPETRHHQSRMSEWDFREAQKAVEKLSKTHFLIRDDIYDLVGILAVARMTKAKDPTLSLIVIDYAQLIRHRGRKGENREQEVAAVSRGLRLLSMELGVCIILLCQLNQDGATRESKSLEQDCTSMLKVLKTDNEEEENTKRLIHIPFQRNGGSGISFQVSFKGHLARFENAAE